MEGEIKETMTRVVTVDVFQSVSAQINIVLGRNLCFLSRYQRRKRTMEAIEIGNLVQEMRAER